MVIDEVLHNRKTLVVCMDATLLWRMRGYIIATTLTVLLVFAGIGYAVDSQMGTAPKWLIVSVLLSFPVANVVTIQWLKRKIIPTIVPKA